MNTIFRPCSIHITVNRLLFCLIEPAKGSNQEAILITFDPNISCGSSLDFVIFTSKHTLWVLSEAIQVSAYTICFETKVKRIYPKFSLQLSPGAMCLYRL